MSVRSNVIDQFKQVAIEQEMRLVPLCDEAPLLDLGLDSLCFAIIVSRLESTLGVDPFSAQEGAPFPMTLGEFVRFYEHAAEQ